MGVFIIVNMSILSQVNLHFKAFLMKIQAETFGKCIKKFHLKGEMHYYLK